MSDTEYCYPPIYRVLKNRLNIRDAEALDRVERRLVVQRVAEGIPSGDFDLTHLRAIHRHLLQDVYAWAGKLRTIEISKDGHQFQFRRFIEAGMADVHRRVAAHHHLRGLPKAEFAARAGEIMGDVNYVHPLIEPIGAPLIFCDSVGPVLWHDAALHELLAQYQIGTEGMMERVVTARIVFRSDHARVFVKRMDEALRLQRLD